MSSSSTPIDIKAVPGLRICTNFFSYDVENKLYNDRFFFPHSQQGVERIARQNKLIKNFRESKCITENESGGIGHLGDNDTGGTGPDLLVKLCNGVIESGTEPEFIAPNNCWPISYPKGGSCSSYNHSRYRFGEMVVGVTLGNSVIMKFTSKKKKKKKTDKKKNKNTSNSTTTTANVKREEIIIDDSDDDDDDDNDDNEYEEDPKPVEYFNRDTGLEVKVEKSSQTGKWFIYVLIPPRSCYVLSGEARYNYTYGVESNTGKISKLFSNNTNSRNPSFTSNSLRRTLTLRTTKFFSDEVLARLLRNLEQDNSNSNSNSIITTKRRIQQRIINQNKFKPEHEKKCCKGTNRITDEQIANHRVDASRLVTKIHSRISKMEKKNMYFTNNERGYKVVGTAAVGAATATATATATAAATAAAATAHNTTPNNGSSPSSSSSTCWPLLGNDSKGGSANPSHWIEKSSAVGYHWGLMPSDLKPTVPTYALEMSLMIRQIGGGRAGAAGGNNTINNIKMGENNNNIDPQQQYEEVLRRSVESKKQEDLLRKVARRGGNTPTTNSGGGQSSAATTIAAASSSSPLSKEAMRAKRLAALLGGDGTGGDGNAITPTTATNNNKRKSYHDPDDTIEILDSSDDDDDDDESIGNDAMMDRKPAAKKLKKQEQEVIDLD